MIASRWKLTHDPTGTPRVLLDNGEAMQGELPWQLEHAFEAVPLVDATWQLLIDGKSSLISLDYTVRRFAATDVDARAAVLDALVAEAAATLKPLKIQLYATARLVSPGEAGPATTKIEFSLEQQPSGNNTFVAYA